MSTERSGTVGGTGGSEFTDDVKARVTAVRVRCGSLIDAIQLLYVDSKGNEAKTTQRGGSGGGEWKFSVPDGDTIVAVRCRGGSKVDSVQFQTAKGTWSPKYGGDGGEEQTFFAPAGKGLAGIFGRSGSKVDRIGFIWADDANAPADSKQTSSSDYFGGDGGSAFNDYSAGVSVERRPIRSITVRSGSKLDSIQVSYNGNNGQPPAHGGSGGSEKTFVVPSGEFITTISLRKGNVIDGIQFFTNKGTGSEWYGGGGGSQSDVKAPRTDSKTTGGGPTYGLAYIQGRSGRLVDGLRFVWAPVAKSVRYYDLTTDPIDSKADVTVVASTTLVNSDPINSQQCDSSIAVNYTDTTSFTSEHSNSYAASVEVSGTLGVPDVASASMTVGFTYTRTDTSSNTYESSQSVDMSVAASQSVPAASTVTATVMSSVYRATNLPYTAKMETTWLDGTKSVENVSGTMSGTFHADNFVQYGDPVANTATATTAT